jgi:UDP-N-acetylglucosamine--N-acetylmuramyl-(pentapeptide) pyrophosphoryl-undecaprenol N-acetylglucosamine transferase
MPTNEKETAVEATIEQAISPSLRLSVSPSRGLKVTIAGGGTGGHIYPGIAIAQEFKRRNAANEIIFVGTAKGLETKIVPREGFELKLLQVAALKRVSLTQRLKSLALLPKSFWDVRQLIASFKPDVVIGVGGYSSGPVVLIASLLGVPTLVAESNALPGFTNRVLARFVKAAAVSFAEAQTFFGNKAEITGNPVRAEFFSVTDKPADDVLDVLITGGSQGARAINEAMIGAAPLLAASGLRFNLLHQTGESDLAKVQAAYARRDAAASVKATAQPFIQQMVAAFAQADVVICRAGATTVAELAAAGKPAVLIPFPFAADDHQRKNAEAVEAAGAGRMIVQAALTPQRLADELIQLAMDKTQLQRMSAASRQLAHPDAAAKVVDLALRICRQPTTDN